ncbi:MAG: hypothetical protein Q7R74_01540 [bacterium]|nr:hypothetical protein [bacterium]
MQFGVIAALLLANIFVWTFPIPHGLRVSFFDVGEGDSVFIQGPTGVKVLVDGGPAGGGVLRTLGSAMPFFDRSLDVVVESTPNADDSAGLTDVLGRYKVGTFIESGILGTTKAAQAVQDAVIQNGTRDVVARRGMRLLLGGGAYADILYPDSDVSNADSGSGSIVMHVVYGATSLLLTGDSSQKIEKYLVGLDGAGLQSDVLKAGHHGSKTSSAPEFVQTVSPLYTIFSRGCANKYGFPSEEVVAVFQNAGAQILDTCENGTIMFVSDGKILQFTAGR